MTPGGGAITGSLLVLSIHTPFGFSPRHMLESNTTIRLAAPVVNKPQWEKKTNMCFQVYKAPTAAPLTLGINKIFSIIQ